VCESKVGDTDLRTRGVLASRASDVCESKVGDTDLRTRGVLASRASDVCGMSSSRSDEASSVQQKESPPESSPRDDMTSEPLKALNSVPFMRGVLASRASDDDKESISGSDDLLLRGVWVPAASASSPEDKADPTERVLVECPLAERALLPERVLVANERFETDLSK